MKNDKQETPMEWFIEQLEEKGKAYEENQVVRTINICIDVSDYMELKQKAKEMEKEHSGYTKEDVLKAGEMGEINHHDTQHIVTYLDEAKEFNKTYGDKK